MTSITLFIDNGAYVGFTANGHSGYAACGSDIVCAAVSALTQTALMGIINVAAAKASYDISEDGGLKCMTYPTPDNAHDVDLIIRVMRCGLTDIQSNYNKFLSVSEKEVTNNV